MPARVRPSFKTPPVNEVVCGIQFRPIALLQAPHYGLFWQKIIKEFPRTRTVAAIGQSIEIPANQEVTLEFGSATLPRVWFISADDSSLVQLQQDRFLFNWREGSNKSRYPRFVTIIKKFKGLFGKFTDFLEDNDLGELSLLGAEVSYINHLQPGIAWQSLDEIGELFPDFAWRRGDRLLPPPNNFTFRTNHTMENCQLGVTIMTARSTTDKRQIIRFDLTAKGSAEQLGGGNEECWEWFTQANECIVDSFLDMTSAKAQNELWQRER